MDGVLTPCTVRTLDALWQPGILALVRKNERGQLDGTKAKEIFEDQPLVWMQTQGQGKKVSLH